MDIVAYKRVKALLNIFHRKWPLIKIRNYFALTKDTFFILLFYFFYFLFHLLNSKLQQLQLLSQSRHAQMDYTPKHTCNSTITHKVCLLLYYKCYSKKKKLIIFVKEDN